MNSCSTVAFIWSPRQLLQSDTGVPHFALDPLTYRCLLSLSPAADFAEPRPPRHKYIPSFRLVQTKVFGFGSLGVYDVRSYISSVNLICVSLCVSVCVHLYVAGSKFLT